MKNQKTCVCKNCKYYLNIVEDWGNCKFNAPIVKKEQRYKPSLTRDHDKELIEEILSTEWTVVYDSDFCGQFVSMKEN